MPLFAITYDLKRPGQDYPTLWKALRDAGAQRALESVWMVKNNQTAIEIRDVLKGMIDTNDRLLVVDVSTWAAVNPMIDINKL